MPTVRAPLLAALLFGVAASQSAAAPLDPQTCATLKSERSTLVAAGAKSDMERGPAQAKATLTPERLQKVERLITIEEQLSFRCDDLVTARPQIKEPPKPQVEIIGGKDAAKPGDAIVQGLPSNIPPPKKKRAAQDAGRN